MSKIIEILKCNRCGRQLYKTETGDVKNENGTMTSNTVIHTVNESLCRFCQEGKK